jgi:alpha-1,2-mannosyltransferase
MNVSALVRAALALAAALFGYAVGHALGGVVGGGLAALVAAAVAVWGVTRPGWQLDLSRCPRPFLALSALATVGALAQLFRLTVFMVDPTAVGFSMVPGSQWEQRHSCATAYFVAAGAVSSPSGPYAHEHYSDLGADLTADPTKPRVPLRLGQFNVDVYEYPPQFLLLPQVLRSIAPEYPEFRLLWYGLCGLFLLAAMVTVARFLGPSVGTVALLLSPLLWVALPTFSHLQKGNVQGVVIAAAMLAMVAFERGRPAAGGALLAFATVSKLYPGLLVVYLLAERRYRDVVWTIAAGILISLITLLDLGWGAYVHFLEHLPQLLGGEAFPALRMPAAMANNFSIPGLVFKAKLFGVPGMDLTAAKIVGWLYTAVILALTLLAAKKSWRPEQKPVVWLGILILATLRSPFLPQAYAALPVLWLLTLLAALDTAHLRRLPWLLLAFAGLNVYWPNDWVFDPRWRSLVLAIPQVLSVVLAVLALRIPRDQTAGEA